ncbi:MAG: hypothetical protein FWG98_03340 [Candidatus Cloacimonetes bacterium]|nr:hypothetical protein [Candidatus Cloacimonadota bacterium]
MKIITFYSFKGGSGRSSTTQNTLPYLVSSLGATKETPILLLDMDLDSAGMTYLMKQEWSFKDKFDIKDFLKGSIQWSTTEQSLHDHRLFKQFVPVGNCLGVEHESVVFLGVDDNPKKIGFDDKDGMQEQHFKNLERFCTNNHFAGIVIDSSAGDQFSAKLSVNAASIVVCCLRATTQFRTGTFRYLDRYKRINKDKDIILLPTVVPRLDREIDGKKQLNAALEDIMEKIKIFELKNINSSFIDYDKLGINEVERFKWREDVLYKLEHIDKITLLEDEKEAANRYQKLSEVIAEMGDE